MSFYYTSVSDILADVLGEEKLPYSVCSISFLPQPGGIRNVISILQKCAFLFATWGRISRFGVSPDLSDTAF